MSCALSPSIISYAGYPPCPSTVGTSGPRKGESQGRALGSQLSSCHMLACGQQVLTGGEQRGLGLTPGAMQAGSTGKVLPVQHGTA